MAPLDFKEPINEFLGRNDLLWLVISDGRQLKCSLMLIFCFEYKGSKKSRVLRLLFSCKNRNYWLLISKSEITYFFFNNSVSLNIFKAFTLFFYLINAIRPFFEILILWRCLNTSCWISGIKCNLGHLNLEWLISQ